MSDHLDISKGVLNTAKLVKKPVLVRGENGKVHTRMQWVKPGEDPNSPKPSKSKEKPEHKTSRENLPLGGAVPTGGTPAPRETKATKTKRMVERKVPATKPKNPKSESKVRHEIDQVRDRLNTGSTKLTELSESQHYGEQNFSKDDVREMTSKVLGEYLTKEGIEKALSSPDGSYEVQVDRLNGIKPFDFSELAGSYMDEDGEYNIHDLSASEQKEVFEETGMVSTNALMLNMNIYGDDGERIGSLERGVDRDEDGTLVVRNESLVIDDEYQGKGIAEGIYARMENLWRDLSYTDDVKISLTANMSVGVYAWATKGFDFANGQELDKARKEFTRFLNNNDMHKEKTFSDLGISGVEDLKTAKDFAELDDGYEYNLSIIGLKGHGHLGKAFMLGGKTMWEASRKISKQDVKKSANASIDIQGAQKMQKDLTWTITKEYKGREGMSRDKNGDTTRDDLWFHPETGLEKASVKKSRKSVGRLDGATSDKAKQSSKHTKLMIDLGLENFKDDVLTTTVTRKSERLVIDISKADNKHLPKGSERHSYEVASNYNVIYIPVNRLKQVYQSDEALNPKKVNENVKKMKAGTALEPVEIGYSYDVHDGHHRWEAAKKIGYTHVPCKVVGKDAEKVKAAREEYLRIWKSVSDEMKTELEKLSVSQFVKDLLSSNLIKADKKEDKKKDEEDDTLAPEEVMSHYISNEGGVDPFDGSDDWKNEVDKNDKKFRKDLGISKGLYIDLFKGLNYAKLVKKRVTVRGKSGKVHSRMQWVRPGESTGDMKHPGVDHSTLDHHEDGIKDLEKRQSNRFPVLHHEVSGLKNTDHNYSTDKAAYAEAEKKYKAGDKLPPVKINPRGEILENAHLVDLAKKHGISHVPVIVIGNPSLKKDLETKLKREANGEEHHDEPTTEETKSDSSNDNTVSDMVNDLDHFLNFTKKKYTKQHLMKEAARQGLTWKTTMNNGTELPENSSILWMHAHKAIVEHIKSGKQFEVNHVEKDVDARMKTDGKDNIHKHFLKLLEKHGSKDALMAWGKDNGIEWKEKVDPSINWKNFVVATKTKLAKGEMVDGIRTRQKDAMKEANTVITDQIKDMVGAYGKKYGKSTVMAKAEAEGIQFSRFDKKGQQLPENSNILWMRAHSAVAKHIAQGGDFKMGGDNGISATTGDYGEVKVTPNQAIAIDAGKRNSNEVEDSAKSWALDALMKDRGLSPEDAEGVYKDFMAKARDKRVLVHFDPHEILPSGVTLMEQLSSDGTFKNDYELGRGLDKEHREANERDMFGDEFDEATDKERPTYGVVDLFNKGLQSHPYNGEVAFVLKNDVKKRTTGSATDSNNIEYGQEGKSVRSMEDPHHLVIDRWQSRWKKIGKADKQRARMFDSVISGTPNNDDNHFFETHVHGGVNFDRDVDHILVPNSWKSDKQHADKHDSIKNFAKQFGLDVNYD